MAWEFTEEEIEEARIAYEKSRALEKKLIREEKDRLKALPKTPDVVLLEYPGGHQYAVGMFAEDYLVSVFVDTEEMTALDTGAYHISRVGTRPGSGRGRVWSWDDKEDAHVINGKLVSYNFLSLE